MLGDEEGDGGASAIRISAVPGEGEAASGVGGAGGGEVGARAGDRPGSPSFAFT